jgi:hypothetical protein
VRCLPLLLLISCATAPRTGPWTVLDGSGRWGPMAGPASASDTAYAQCIVEAVHDLTGDPFGLMDQGGQIGLMGWGDLDQTCGEAGAHITGCDLDQFVLVVVDGSRIADIQHSALAHELIHLALKAQEGDPRIAATELLVQQRCLP